MTVVSSKEFVSNEDKYLDMAMNGQVYIQRGNCMFIVSMANNVKKKHLEPDDDFRRAISGEELKKRMHISIAMCHVERSETSVKTITS